MRVVIAGSREETDELLVWAAVRNSGFEITTVLSGTARGVDRSGESWATAHGIPIERYPADWSQGRGAGHARNKVMIDAADALIAVWDGDSPGTAQGISYAERQGIPVYVERTDHWYSVYTDGASRKDGRGGYGILIQHPSKDDEELVGGDYDTTNGRMELLGPIEAMWHLPEYSDIEFFVDAQYVTKGATEWLEGWKRRNWVKGDDEPVKNRDLWEELDAAMQRHRRVRWTWVKGHSGVPGNERADRLSQQGVPPKR